ncbi:transposase [Planctomycetota bacterium]
MARGARIDYPGALHHIMVRGIERRDLFKDDIDREMFMYRFTSAIEATGAICFAFALMSNHIHLLLETGRETISRTMQRLLTGYALDFNFRHRRTGKLYQNRFKSILCDADLYLDQLVRYIHLNPQRVGIVKTLQQLDRFEWTSHSSYMGQIKRPWVASKNILKGFGRSQKTARQKYRQYIQDGIDNPEPDGFSGGGLIRSIGSIGEILKMQKKGEKEYSDERILGSGAFVEEVIKATEMRLDAQERFRREGWTIEKVIVKAAAAVRIDPEELLYAGRNNARSVGRALACKWALDDLGLSSLELGERLGISRSAISYMKSRGRKVEKDMGIAFNGLFH